MVSAESLSCVGPLHALPDVAFPPVGPLGLGSPPSSVLCSAKTATVPLSSRFARRSLPDTLPASLVCGVPKGLCPHQGSGSAGTPALPACSDKETGGSPKFPSSPSEDMPRSQTPVVSCALAKAHPGLLPSGACKPSAFPSVLLRDILADHDYTNFGAQSRGLPPRSPSLRASITG